MQYNDLILKWLGHAGFLIRLNNKIIFIDPFQIKSQEKADLILITHGHYDHFSIEDIKKIIKKETIIIGPIELLSLIRKLENINFQIAEEGKIIDIEGIKIQCYASYNINKPNHHKGDGVSYIIDNGTRIYHSGDSDLIPEMSKIKSDIVLLAVSGKVNMNANEAAKAALIMNAKLAIPMHWGSIIGDRKDAEKFVELCKESKIDSKILEKE